MRDQRRAEQALGFLLDVLDRFDDLDAARLAAAAGVDLGFYHPDRTAKFLRGSNGLFDRKRRQAVSHGNPELAKNRLTLILVDIHRECFPPVSIYFARCGAILMQASIRPFTESTDLSNIARSVASILISTTRSTPLAPITTGTPT